MTKRTINQGVALEEREKRGLTQSQMAEILGVEGLHAEQILMDFETGFRPVKGSVLRVYEALNRGRWSACELLEMPRWSISAIEGGGLSIHHNEWPRFVGRTVSEALHPQQWRFKKAGMPAYELDARLIFRQLVFVFYDHVPEGYDPEDQLEEAVRLVERSLLREVDDGV